MEKEFTLSIYTENSVGILGRICAIFTRRKLSIDSITAMKSETPGLYRYTLVLKTTEEQIKKVAGQIDKQVDVAKVSVFHREETEYMEIALFKIDTNKEENLLEIIKNQNARIVSMHKGETLVEITGHDDEIDTLRGLFQPESIIEFVRSGRIALAKKSQHAYAE